MNRTGDVETLFAAFGLSPPRGESPRPITLIAGSTALSASYEAASNEKYELDETLSPAPPNCGCQNRGWFGSLPMMKSFTVGYVRASRLT